MHLIPAVLILALLSLSTLRAQAQPRASAEGVVRSNVEKVYYDIEGDSPSEIAVQLRQNGPRARGKGYFGMTDWEVRAEYRSVRRPAGCRISGLTVHASVQTHLPRWGHAAAAPRELRGAWDHFLHALDRHEHGHRALAEEAAEAVRRRLVALRAPNCARLEAQAHRDVVTVLNEYEQYNHAYDAATNHGRSQGAVWPPARRQRLHH